jgi:uncharacterized protein YndB with AHSA1/START domain
MAHRPSEEWSRGSLTNPPRSADPPKKTITIRRSYPAAPAQIWDLWTTAHGIESWWAPDGFKVEVLALDVRPGGTLRYAMTATAAPQIEFMQSAGMPLTTETRKTFTEVERPTRLAYVSLADFIPGVEPYEFLTIVDLEPEANGTRVMMTVDRMHDDEWTQRLLAGRENELENLAKIVERPH